MNPYPDNQAEKICQLARQWEIGDMTFWMCFARKNSSRPTKECKGWDKCRQYEPVQAVAPSDDGDHAG